jgi:hypothetical protein
MSRFSRLARLSLRHLVVTCCLALLPAIAGATPCEVVDNGSGTVQIPAPGCGYLSPADVHQILNGLPPGTTVQLGAQHERFGNIIVTPGGPLGGEHEQYTSMLQLNLKGTGTLAGWQRTIVINNVQCQTNTAPRVPGSAVQSFDTDMDGIMAQLPGGDPDFDLLRITAGTGFGMPSPGHTTLTRLPNGNWNIDSFFDISYRIDYVGAPGGHLSGHSGSTTGTIRMGTGQPAPGPCVQPDAGGTVTLPPQGCGYLSPADVHQILNGLPAGTTVRLGAEHQEFFGIQHSPGGSLGGEVEQYGSFLTLHLSGTGTLAGWTRTLGLQAQCETHTAPRFPGTPVQSFDTDMFGIQGQLPPGDPDFDLLRITAGSGFGMPSPGHTTLTKLSSGPSLGPGGQWNVDSFFDITYRIDFVGAPGGRLAGRSGSTTGTIRMQTGQTATSDVPNPRPPGNVSLSSRPNPFENGTSIEYRLSSTASVKLRVYDTAGKLVRTLTDTRLPAGPHAMYWDGRNDAGRKLSSGTYFIKLTVDGQAAGSHRTTIIK